MRKTEAERFWEKVDKHGPMFNGSACWVWTAFKHPDGYGAFWAAAGKMVRAHRWVYANLEGPILEGLELDHLCRNRACVNPDHLEPVDHRVNVQRGLTSALRPLGQIGARGSLCVNGHAYGVANIFVTSAGYRECRQCRQTSFQKAKAKRKQRRLEAISYP